MNKVDAITIPPASLPPLPPASAPVVKKPESLPSKPEYSTDSCGVSPLEKICRFFDSKGIFRARDTIAPAEEPAVDQVLATSKPPIALPRMNFSSAPPTQQIQQDEVPVDPFEGSAIENLLRQVWVAEDELGRCYLRICDKQMTLRSEENRTLWDVLSEAREKAQKMEKYDPAFKWIGYCTAIIGSICAAAALAIFLLPAELPLLLGVLPEALQLGLGVTGSIAGMVGGGMELVKLHYKETHKELTAQAQKTQYLHQMNSEERDELTKIIGEIVSQLHKKIKELCQLRENQDREVKKSARDAAAPVA